MSLLFFKDSLLKTARSNQNEGEIPSCSVTIYPGSNVHLAFYPDLLFRIVPEAAVPLKTIQIRRIISWVSFFHFGSLMTAEDDISKKKKKQFHSFVPDKRLKCAHDHRKCIQSCAATMTPLVVKPVDGEGAGSLRIIAPTETYSIHTPWQVT